MEAKQWGKLTVAALVIVMTVVSASPKEGDLCTTPYSCTGCSQVRICRHTASGLRDSFRFSCSGTTPFCDENTGTCTASPTSDCADIGVLTCMQDGVFPDLMDPKKYHVCQKGTSHTFNCQSGYFDGKACNTTIYSYTPFSCSLNSGTKVKHYLDNNVFAYCVNGKVLFVDRCPKGQRLYPEYQECLPVCTYSGQLIADFSNESRCFVCSKSYYDKDYSLKSLDCALCETSCSCCYTKETSCTCSNCSC